MAVYVKKIYHASGAYISSLTLSCERRIYALDTCNITSSMWVHERNMFRSFLVGFMVSVIQSKTSSLEIDCGGIQLKGVALKQKHRKRAKKRKEVVFTILPFVMFLYIKKHSLSSTHHNLCCWLESSSLKKYSEFMGLWNS